MFWKRQVPLLIVALIGSITLFGWFIDQQDVKEFIGDDATQWFDVLASFAIILGALNLIKMQIQKVLYQKPGWQYSVIAVLGFIFAIIGISSTFVCLASTENNFRILLTMPLTTASPPGL